MFAVRRFASSRVVAAGAAKRVRAYTVTPALTQLSSLSEPDATLFKSYKLESSAPSTSYLDEQLRDDVRTMGSTLGQVIKDHDGTEVFDKVEHMRNLAKVSDYSTFIVCLVLWLLLTMSVLRLFHLHRHGEPPAPVAILKRQRKPLKSLKSSLHSLLPYLTKTCFS
jgi:hypothetical protein